KSERLPDDLVALGARVTREVGNVERQRRPKSDHAGQAGNKERPELAGLGLTGIEGGGLREDRPEAAGIPISPREQQQTKRDEKRRLDVQKKPDRFDPFVNNEHVDAPKKEEADEFRQGDAEEGRCAGGC